MQGSQTLYRHKTKIQGHLKLVDTPRSTVGLNAVYLPGLLLLTLFLILKDLKNFFTFLIFFQVQSFIQKSGANISSTALTCFMTGSFRPLAAIL